MNPRYARVADRAAHRCEYCHAPEVIFNFPFEVEHIIPPGQAGFDTDGNWALACRSCNLFKSDGIEGTDPGTGMSAPLFHPRHDAWDQHFAPFIDEGTIIGQTPSGRATVQLLRMNSPTQIFARTQWSRLGLFP